MRSWGPLNRLSPKAKVTWRIRSRLWRGWLLALVEDRPTVAASLAGLTAAAVVWPALGLVAALLTGGYAAWGILRWHRVRVEGYRRLRQAAARQRVSLLAADLRVGAAPYEALTTVAGEVIADCPQIARRLTAIAAIVRGSGAPAADLLDRLASDLRSQVEATASLAANTAGTRASARLLAVLPLAGIALGESIGADPVGVLLYTPVGLGCLCVAVGLQLAGLFWSSRIARIGLGMLGAVR